MTLNLIPIKMKKTSQIIFLLGFLFCSLITIAQQNYQQDLVNKDYTSAIKKAKEAIKNNNNDGLAHYVLGFSYTKLNKNKEAIKYLSLAKEKGYNSNPINLNLAKNYIALKKNNQALDVLEEAANNGMPRFGLLQGPEFSIFVDNERFKKIYAKMTSNAYPCKSDEKRNRFNFWLGEWDVFANGNKIAISRISSSNGNCAILEDYQTFGIIGGNSLSHYNSKTKKWMQTYTDAQGSVSYYVEADKPYEGDLQMIAKSSVVNGSETNRWIRMTYFNNTDGTVRQFMESSADKGKKWTPIFNGLYKKRKKNN